MGGPIAIHSTISYPKIVAGVKGYLVSIIPKHGEQRIFEFDTRPFRLRVEYYGAETVISKQFLTPREYKVIYRLDGWE